MKGFFQGGYDPYAQDEYDEYGAGEGKYPLDHVVEEKEYINDLLNRGYQPTWDEKSPKKSYVPDPNIYNYRKVVFGDDDVSKISHFYYHMIKKFVLNSLFKIVTSKSSYRRRRKTS